LKKIEEKAETDEKSSELLEQKVKNSPELSNDSLQENVDVTQAAVREPVADPDNSEEEDFQDCAEDSNTIPTAPQAPDEDWKIGTFVSPDGIRRANRTYKITPDGKKETYRPKFLSSTKFPSLRDRLLAKLNCLQESDRKDLMDVIFTMEEKYREAKSIIVFKKKSKPVHRPRTRTEAAELLNPRPGSKQQDVESANPWMPTEVNKAKYEEMLKSFPQGMLYRIYDDSSSGKLRKHSEGIISGLDTVSLDTPEARHHWIKAHSNWGNRLKTPLISWTRDHRDITDTRVPASKKRQEKKKVESVTKLTTMNARARIAKGLPLLSMKEQQEYYHVVHGYGFPKLGEKDWYVEEFLALFTVSADEEVGTWCWEHVEKFMKDNGFVGWIVEVAVPALEKHEEARLKGVALKGGCSCSRSC
jgi:hypothetical protein